MKVSKELFNEIRQFKEFDFSYTYNILTEEIERGMESFCFICKEWAYSKGYVLSSHKNCCYIYSLIMTFIDEINGSSEVEAVIKSCEWILKEGN